MSDKQSNQIEVSAVAQYVADQSEPEADRYVFAYTITIRNTGMETAQLISRHWVIADSEGQMQEVRGVGVVGEQPRLAPGDSFVYTSGCAIRTPVGTMRGSYLMQAEDGSNFEADIPEFLLAAPGTLH